MFLTGEKILTGERKKLGLGLVGPIPCLKAGWAAVQPAGGR